MRSRTQSNTIRPPSSIPDVSSGVWSLVSWRMRGLLKTLNPSAPDSFEAYLPPRMTLVPLHTQLCQNNKDWEDTKPVVIDDIPYLVFEFLKAYKVQGQSLGSVKWDDVLGQRKGQEANRAVSFLAVRIFVNRQRVSGKQRSKARLHWKVHHCSVCKSQVHYAPNCPYRLQTPQQMKAKCQLCEGRGHDASICVEPVCANCGNPHLISRCFYPQMYLIHRTQPGRCHHEHIPLEHVIKGKLPSKSAPLSTLVAGMTGLALEAYYEPPEFPNTYYND